MIKNYRKIILVTQNVIFIIIKKIYKILTNLNYIDFGFNLLLLLK